MKFASHISEDAEMIFICRSCKFKLVLGDAQELTIDELRRKLEHDC